MGGGLGGYIVELSNSSISEIRLDEEYDRWVGGRGLGAWLAYKRLISGEDPGALIVLGKWTGLLGQPFSRTSAVFVSPQRRALHHSSIGGELGHALASNGIRLLWLRGTSETPVKVVVERGEVRVEPADELWGLGTRECAARLKEYDEVLCIGPAGESGVRYASVISKNGDAFGRGGLGALLGAMKVKAIAVKRWTARIQAPEKVVEVVRRLAKAMAGSEVVQELRSVGTLGMLARRLGAAPSRNFLSAYPTQGVAEEWRARVGRGHQCAGCPIACKKSVRGVKAMEWWGGLVALGTMLGIYDLDRAQELYELATDLGLDAVSAGHTIAHVFEARNWWGDADVAKSLMLDAVYRRGELGEALAEGSAEVARRLGVEPIVVKGVDGALCDPRRDRGFALAAATASEGFQRQIALMRIVVPGKAEQDGAVSDEEYARYVQDLQIIADSLGLCIFATYYASMRDLAELAGMAVDELKSFATRVWKLERESTKLLIGQEQRDELPPRLDPGIAPLLPRYYELRG